MKKIKKSTGVAIAFLIYVSVTAAYLLPRNTEVGQTEKILTVVGSYVIVLLLWHGNRASDGKSVGSGT